MNNQHWGKALIIGSLGLLVLWLTSCGVNLNHKVSGGAKVDTHSDVEVTVTHKVDLDNLKVYFASLCKEKVPTDRCYNVDNAECVNCEIADFLVRVQ